MPVKPWLNRRALSRAAAALALAATLAALGGCGGGGGGGGAAGGGGGNSGGTPTPPITGSVNLAESRGVWLNRQLLRWPGIDATGVHKLYWSAKGAIQAGVGAALTGADGSITLEAYAGSVPEPWATRFKWVGAGATLAVKAGDLARLSELHRAQLVLVQETDGGLVRNATTTQIGGALDDLYAGAADVGDLGATLNGGNTRFKVWAPTAQKVSLVLYDSLTGSSSTTVDMARDDATGTWSVARTGDLSGRAFHYRVEVFVRGTGLVTNLVTDPYSLALTADSARSVVVNLNAPSTQPAGWSTSRIPATVAAAPDMSIYELHVRDFSAHDASVSAARRGTYLAFTETNANGMKHLRALAQAGLTDVHLLPVFDIASVPEVGCTTPSPSGAADSSSQQATVGATRGTDCYNWGYDPWHYTAPEGSYATSVADPLARIVEFRAMVQALHAAGLRVGMDVVYNHTTASGQNAKSVLDRIVPGYYHRLNAAGGVETSTCCDNTATENRMMEKLMTDSVVVWARDYRISSFRFDIMGHQPRAAMERLQTAVNAAAGRPVQLLGEGWNFGEVADGARFVQASMWSLNGSGIGTFNPFPRDAIRGGGPFDNGNALVANQGFVNGLHYDPNALGMGKTRSDLMLQGDIVRAGLAGAIRGYTMTLRDGTARRLEEFFVYPNQPAGYVTQPSEVVNYAENHDNQTLFDNHAYKLPVATSREDRARVQMLSAAITMFSQGIAYFHAGIDTLRSKSFDRNSYDSGDWFNRLDWSYQDNYYGTGLPPAWDNGSNWGVMQPLLADARIKPTGDEIAWTRDAFRDLLRIRSSSTLLRLRTAADISARLKLHNTGPEQVATVLVGQLDGAGHAGAGFSELVYLVNVDKVAQTVTVDALKAKGYVLHPVHRAFGAADRRALEAVYEGGSGRFTVPARTAVVFVRP
jgi:pullulanase/glycogen debranching enzyme